jgi:hypothetical protein
MRSCRVTLLLKIASGMTGPAGSCLINNTEIWHTNTPNRADHERRLIMILYEHARKKPWQEGYDISAAFAAQQRDPLRRQLCGCLSWHKGEELFPARDWRPPRQDKPA